MVKRELEEHATATISIASKYIGIYIGITAISVLAVIGAYTIITWII